MCTCSGLLTDSVASPPLFFYPSLFDILMYQLHDGPPTLYIHKTNYFFHNKGSVLPSYPLRFQDYNILPLDPHNRLGSHTHCLPSLELIGSPTLCRSLDSTKYSYIWSAQCSIECILYYITCTVYRLPAIKKYYNQAKY